MLLDGDTSGFSKTETAGVAKVLAEQPPDQDEGFDPQGEEHLRHLAVQ